MITIQFCSPIPLPLLQKSSLSPVLLQPGNPISPFIGCQSRNRSGTQTRKRNSFRNGGGSDPVEENGVVEPEQDIDGYLGSLSLEYDAIWDTKPSWCQPWTIALTGISIIAVSWLSIKSIAVTSIATALVSLWWYIFLYSYPKAYSEMIAERRNRVKRGLEDTFGAEIDQ